MTPKDFKIKKYHLLADEETDLFKTECRERGHRARFRRYSRCANSVPLSL